MNSAVTAVVAAFSDAMRDIDRANADDPRNVLGEGTARPVELVYSERMSACLADLYPQASELLQLAARAQHIRRWEIARSRYPLGRDGYNAWRTACRDHHAALVTNILGNHGYGASDVAHVVKLIRKEHLKRDFESQALENVVGVVFVKYYLDDFLSTHATYDDDRVIGIIAKTLRKMSADGHAALRSLPLEPAIRRMIEQAAERS